MHLVPPVQSWWHRSRRRLTIGDRDPTGNLRVLPPEVIMSMAEFLPDASQLALALTCRPYYSLFHDRGQLPRLTTRRDREEFLQMLESETPHLYFCHDCVQLHPWSRRWTIAGHRSCREYRCANETKHSIPLKLSPYTRRTLPYHFARLFMNRHLFGPAHGLPLAKLALDKRHSLNYGVALRATRAARVLDDELFLLSTYALHHARGKARRLRRCLDEANLRLCHHVRLGGGADRHEGVYAVPELQRRSVNEPFAACDGAAASCPKCFTDYALSVRWDGRERGWAVELRVYRGLGACRSPFDWKWRIAGETVGISYNEPRHLHHPAGGVRERWLAAEGAEGAERGGFVGPVHDTARYVEAPRRCPWNTSDHNVHDCANYGMED